MYGLGEWHSIFIMASFLCTVKYSQPILPIWRYKVASIYFYCIWYLNTNTAPVIINTKVWPREVALNNLLHNGYNWAKFCTESHEQDDHSWAGLNLLNTMFNIRNKKRRNATKTRFSMIQPSIDMTGIRNERRQWRKNDALLLVALVACTKFGVNKPKQTKVIERKLNFYF